MVELFYMGGSLFMGVLTLLLMGIVAITIAQFIALFNGKAVDVSWVKSIGLFALVFGVLGQFIGLYSAFQSIEQVGQVSQALLAGGLKVSSITSMYGIVICLISYLLWFGLKMASAKMIARQAV
ncbi:MotA/TolQ/ExbB proton channel family protein [Reichenbachiella agariperforans]|uniref:MotA/TolQ/ExbB proton channel family protein n=1 Tax=Reichenbachiella agariperforans TaxID=156994 RepID=A0A1M6NCR0_REIAG|nr:MULTISPECIES: MotA/TolQ/ExbB proton channel family protein [Reichenbachiella]SHJ93481.1 MotA/TolQ/ExbB proton channel family protein [Reichenbachiella agariperforans]